MDKVEQGKAAKKQTISEIRAKKKAVTKTVRIQLDGQIANELAALREAHRSARDADRLSNEPDKAPAITAEIEDLVERATETEAVFEFQSIGRPNYDALVEQPEHKPTKDQKRDGAQFNTDTFPPAVVSATCVNPEITLEEAVEMFSDPAWNGAELARLFEAAVSVNTDTGDIPLSRNDSEGTLGSVLNLLTQQSMESLTPST